MTPNMKRDYLSIVLYSVCYLVIYVVLYVIHLNNGIVSLLMLISYPMIVNLRMRLRQKKQLHQAQVIANQLEVSNRLLQGCQINRLEFEGYIGEQFSLTARQRYKLEAALEIESIKVHGQICKEKVEADN